MKQVIREWKTMHEINRKSRYFCIKLANKESWKLVSTSETNEWLEKLCNFMGLNEQGELEGPEIIFLRNVSMEYDYIKSLNICEIHKWSTGPLCIYQCQNSLNVICEIGNTDSPEVELFKMTQSILPIYTQVLFKGGLPFHSALIEKRGIGIVIAAPSGTGKTTCANRIPYPWKALCDDEVLIVRDKNGIYHAHPFPTWSRFNTQEKREVWNVQSHVPISAILFLKKSQKDDITPLSFSQSASLIYKLSLPVFSRVLGYVDKKEQVIIKKLIFENACDIAKDIPAFILNATLTGKFWEVIEKALSMKPGGNADTKI
jgi:SynChlorMet cassette protein ScmC